VNKTDSVRVFCQHSIKVTKIFLKIVEKSKEAIKFFVTFVYSPTRNC